MKKQRRLKLEMNKVSVSKLNNIKGAGGPIGSVNICAISTEPFTCEFTMELTSCANFECTIRTGVTIINQSVGAC